MKTLIADTTIVNEGRCFQGSLLLEDDVISAVIEEGNTDSFSYDRLIDAKGCVVMPGVIDTHVHFREPGLSHKADIASESRAAAAGGVTSFFDMPNVVPPTVTIDALNDKYRRAAEKSIVNYAFFFGATNDNTDIFAQLDTSKIPGVKLFMGSSTGNMLVEGKEALEAVFNKAGIPIVAHCEDTGLINANMKRVMTVHGEDPDVSMHPLIRSREACLASTRLAMEMAQKTGARLHVAHVTMAEELELFEPYLGGDELPSVTAEAVIAHLCFTDADYGRLGARIKCNPAVKTAADRDALRKGLTDGRLFTVATDHAPHLMSEKQGGCRKAASGMPMVQFSLSYMLQLVDEGVLPIERVPVLMAHQPARLFGIQQRGFIRPGYKADIVVVQSQQPHTVTTADVLSKCGWSPLEGHSFQWRVRHTFCNGRHVYDDGRIDNRPFGEPILFKHDK